MNCLPLVSVIVLAYNQENTISRTLDSILNQKCDFPFEIIIGEDASADKTRDICLNYAGKYDNIVLLKAEPNKGLLENYNDCLKFVRGKYISECAGDDWWHNPDKLRLQVKYMDENPDCILCYTDYNQYHVDKDKTIKCVLGRKNVTKSIDLNCLLSGFFIPTLTIMYRAFAKGYFDMSEFKMRGYMAEDLPMYLELCKYGTLDYIPKSTATYSIQKGSISQFVSPEKMVVFMENMRKIKLDFLKDNKQLTNIAENELNEIYDRAIFNSAFSMCAYDVMNEYAMKIDDFGSLAIKIKYFVYRNKILYDIYTLLRRII